MGSKIVSSEIKFTEQHNFTWKLPDFASLRTQREVRSNLKMISRVGLPPDCAWTCSLIRSSSSSSLDTLQIELSKKPANLKEINASFRIQIKRTNKDDNFYYDSKAGPVVNMTEKNWTFQLFPFVSFANLSLEFEITITVYSLKPKPMDEILNNFKAKFTEKLQSDFANMLKTSSLPRADSTTVIRCKEDVTEFQVHRGMLAARSNWFLRIFESKVKQDYCRILEVTDVSSAVMKIILHFLYTGILLETWTSVSTDELLYGTAKYEVGDLLEFLDNVMVHICTETNAGKLMNLARKLNSKRAESDLFNFINICSESYEQFEKFMEDAKSDISFERMFATKCTIQPVEERKNEEDLNDYFEEIDSDDLEFID